MKNKHNQNGGFTLIEMVVVIIILAILAGIGIPQYLKTVEKGRCAEAIGLLGIIRQSQESYLARNGSYAQTTDDSLTTLFDKLETEIKGKAGLNAAFYFTYDDALDTSATDALYTVVVSRNSTEKSVDYKIRVVENGKIEGCTAIPTYLNITGVAGFACTS